jgi:hypothetical protein
MAKAALSYAYWINLFDPEVFRFSRLLREASSDLEEYSDKNCGD